MPRVRMPVTLGTVAVVVLGFLSAAVGIGTGSSPGVIGGPVVLSARGGSELRTAPSPSPSAGAPVTPESPVRAGTTDDTAGVTLPAASTTTTKTPSHAADASTLAVRKTAPTTATVVAPPSAGPTDDPTTTATEDPSTTDPAAVTGERNPTAAAGRSLESRRTPIAAGVFASPRGALGTSATSATRGMVVTPGTSGTVRRTSTVATAGSARAAAGTGTEGRDASGPRVAALVVEATHARHAALRSGSPSCDAPHSRHAG